MCFTPLRFLERVCHGKKYDAVEITHPPLFILGHFRTGTTYLHNLLVQDPQFAFLSTFQVSAPQCFLIVSRTLRPLFHRRLPRTRLMDNMTMSLDLPQEEEIALARMSPHSVYHWWCFPRRMRFYFDRYALFDGLPEAGVEAWKRNYLALLKRATYQGGGRQLVLKNPANTSRIRLLLELFPEAKFVHIRRNPYTVYASTKHLYLKMLQAFALQRYEEREVEDIVLYIYERMMRRFFEERALIPDSNFVEVRFEDLETDALRQLRRIYGELGIEGSDEAEAALRNHIASQSSYKKNVFRLQPADIERIDRHWGFAVEKWGYAVPAELISGQHDVP
jgi:hypothetical protein